MLTKIDKDLWYDEFDLFMSGGIHFRGRMTVVRLKTGEILLHSPIPLDDKLAAEIEALGEVKYLVAPCGFHHLHLPAAIERYPDAKVYGAQGLDEKRKDISFDAMLTSEVPTELEDDFAMAMVDGSPQMNEVVFFHKPTQTLIVTDLVFNIHEVANFRSKFLFWFMGAWKKPAQSRLWRMLTKDRQAAGSSVHKILQMDFTRVVMAHGRILEENAKEQFTQAVSWMLQGHKAQLAA